MIKKTVMGLMIGFGCALCFSQGVRPAEGAFPFNVLDMADGSPVSCRDLNTQITNESPRVVTGEDGHLYVGGERLRIFGTNLSAFPEKSQAERNARSLADRGYNCIRFHHTDADWTNCFIKKAADGKRIVDGAALDKFDYFVFMMKKYGIYTNLNLLTGRTYTEKDGMPSGTDKISDWKNRHLLGFWNEKARNLQKDYARILLEHVNPYTSIPLKDDPALCIVEINNEQGMIHSYFSNNFFDTPDNLWDELEVQWNKWLSARGNNFESLSAQFNKGYEAGKKLIDASSRWNLEQHEGAKAAKTEIKNGVTLNITGNGGASWHIQYNTGKLNIEPDKAYTVSLKAKASKKCDVSLSLMMAHDPWSNIGWNKKISLDKEWNTYEFVVTGLQPDTNARLNIGEMGFLTGTKIEFKDIFMQEGGKVVSVEQTANGVRLPKASDYGELPEKFKNLVLNFLYDVETEYWTDMRDFVRNTLGCKALQMGSAMGNVTTGHSMIFDIVDSHAYFNHPAFPGRDWDISDFYVDNKDMTVQDYSKTMTNLSGLRVFGKPFSVSEYDHPYPNQFSAQMYPMWAAYASYQDWDALYSFCSEVIEPVESKNKKISGYFDQTHNPVKTAATPIAARIFRTGAVKPEETVVWMELTEALERDNLQSFGGWNIGNPSVWGYEPAMAMDARTGILWNEKSEGLNGLSVEERAESLQVTKSNLKTAFFGVRGKSDESYIFWEEEKGTFAAMGENAFVYVGRKGSPLLKKASKEQLNNFEFIPEGDFISLMGVRKEDGKWIFFAGSWSGNQNEQLRDYGNRTSYSGNKNSVQRGNVRITSRPSYETGNALALSVSGTLKPLKGNMKMIPLSEKGLPSGKPVKAKAFDLKEDSGTLWYLLEP